MNQRRFEQRLQNNYEICTLLLEISDLGSSKLAREMTFKVREVKSRVVEDLSKNLAEVRGVERPEREAWSAWRLSRKEREEVCEGILVKLN